MSSRLDKRTSLSDYAQKYLNFLKLSDARPVDWKLGFLKLKLIEFLSSSEVNTVQLQGFSFHLKCHFSNLPLIL